MYHEFEEEFIYNGLKLLEDGGSIASLSKSVGIDKTYHK
ncbi:MAG: hypothetical protein ACJATI_000204 [Halioglobus sp.]|jgi:hypothetical protein